jgi:hypothetical protein
MLRLRHRPTLEQIGTVSLLLIAVAVVGVVGLSWAFTAASDDLFASVAEAQGRTPDGPRVQPGIWLASVLVSDLAPEDLIARRARADQLHYRGERTEEIAAVGAIVGLLVAVLSASPSSTTGRRREASSPAANTASNGTA